MITEDYIQHEVQLRIHDVKFLNIEEAIKKIDGKINWIIGIILTSVVLPIALHAVSLI